MLSLINSFSRNFLLKTCSATARALHTSSPVCITSTPVLFAEPLKKKKKLDPQVIKHREERKRKKLEKQIKRLERNARQLKPIEELEVPLTLLDEKKERERLITISLAVAEQRNSLQKSWSKFRMEEKLADFQLIDKLLICQNKALQELKLESEELYLEAIQTDLNLLPFITRGPVASPPLESYESPDGEYIDMSKKWE